MANKGKFRQPRTHGQSAVTEKNRKKTLLTAVIAAGGAALLALAVTFFAGLALVNGDTIYPDVRVAGVDVGGMTAPQAQQTVEEAVAETYRTSTMEVQLPDRTLTFDPEQTNVSLNAEAAIQEAMAFGRRDGAFMAAIRYLFDRDRDLELQTALDMDTGYIRSIIDLTAKAVRTAPEHSTMSINADMTKMEISVGVPGQELDADGLYEAVCSAFQSREFTPLVWDYMEVPCKEADLPAIEKALGEQATDAYYDEDARKIVESVCGYQFDREKVAEALAAAKPGVTLTFPLQELQPELTTSELTFEMFGEKLESRSSKYVNNPKRTENLRLACEAINGTILNPGDLFSFNEVVGERTAEKGYQPATVYGGEGESVEDLGGGICQVASTIYYAALYMDLEQVAREPHMYQVTYVPPGMDATIYWGSKLDYQFRNNREHPIKIQANVDDGSCNITFWGVRESDNYVEMSYNVLYSFTDEPEEELDETKPVGFRELKQTAYTGASVVAVQKVFDGSGKLLREEKINSLYKSRPEIYIVGPAEDAPIDPEFPTDPELPWGDIIEDPLNDPLNTP